MNRHDWDGPAQWQRRSALAGLALAVSAPLLSLLPRPVGAQTGSALTELATLWRREGGVLLVRHAVTEAGLGDPPEFVLGQCRTQRNLSPEGQRASRAMGEWARAQGLKPDAVRTSQWCRCQDTARLAFGQYEDWPALNSTFAGQGNPAAQIQALRERLLAMPAGRTEVWVTHQVIMTALTGAYPEMGEGFWVDAQGRLRARARVAA
ncbi:histidine phosphatase family protein [Limnohabitans sp. G3-2]|uniref:histidine phosphatase family protein n=1 Tax=Limnohabitans sp. G3-2 TaxID=1100711 RepID=UPI000C1F75C8|nr:histidine phosphatase family protein [Limnohabitans sp. G3-2]PIT73338.1 histidine phosphatase family protein [Limnohabitans sp. G3-2]